MCINKHERRTNFLKTWIYVINNVTSDWYIGVSSSSFFGLVFLLYFFLPRYFSKINVCVCACLNVCITILWGGELDISWIVLTSIRCLHSVWEWEYVCVCVYVMCASSFHDYCLLIFSQENIYHSFAVFVFLVCFITVEYVNVWNWWKWRPR